MKPEILQQIQTAYDRSKTSSIELFQTLLAISKESGWDQTLAALEACVLQRRLNWWRQFAPGFVASGHPCRDAFQVFYETYLKASVPLDGEIVSTADGKWVTRWWNPCSTLVACQHLGLDTREVCRKVYEKPVQELFARIDPRLRFRRNYAAIRPHAPYCEEIIELDG